MQWIIFSICIVFKTFVLLLCSYGLHVSHLSFGTHGSSTGSIKCCCHGPLGL